MEENTPDSSWRYTGGQDATQEYASEPTFGGQSPKVPIQWTASEYLAHDKSPFWFAGFGLVAFVAMATVYLVSKDILSTIVIFIIAVGVGAYGSRKPRAQQYQFTAQGMNIGGRSYSYSDFKSFAIVQDDAMPTIWLIPLQKIIPPIIFYCDPALLDQVIELLSDYLPHEQRDYDRLERLMRYLRF